MGVMKDDWYRDAVPTSVDLEVDAGAVVSNGDDSGAWVQCWVWVPDPADAEEVSDK